MTPRDVHSQLMPTHVKEPVKGVRNGSSWQGKYRMKCIEMSECEKLKLKHKTLLDSHNMNHLVVFHFNTLTLSTLTCSKSTTYRIMKSSLSAQGVLT